MNAEFEALAIRCRAPEQHTGPVGTRQSHRLPHKPLEDGRIHTSARVSNSPLMECHAQLSTGTLRANATNPPWPKGQDRFRGLLVRRAQQKLQHAEGGQLGGREPRTSVSRISAREVLIAPQPVQPVPYPHCRRATRVARPGDLRGQTGPAHQNEGEATTDTSAAESDDETARDAHRSRSRTGKHQDHRRSGRGVVTVVHVNNPVCVKP
jgi:hypothetical protein